MIGVGVYVYLFQCIVVSLIPLEKSHCDKKKVPSSVNRIKTKQGCLQFTFFVLENCFFQHNFSKLNLFSKDFKGLKGFLTRRSNNNRKQVKTSAKKNHPIHFMRERLSEYRILYITHKQIVNVGCIVNVRVVVVKWSSQVITLLVFIIVFLF